MKIYFNPVDTRRWNMFEEVLGIGHIEDFYAVKSMEIGDIMLLHVGSHDNRYKSGVYAAGVVVTEPFEKERLRVLVRITQIQRVTPIITTAEVWKFNQQFRSVHMIDPQYYDKIMQYLDADC